MNCARLAALLAASALTCTAQAALQGRDLNGDSAVDAFYDTDLDITWRRNANVNGLMNWANAVSWADNHGFGGYTDWRLPTSDACVGYNCTGSEMGHLWYSELGNVAGDLTPNTGRFVNMQLYAYWSGTAGPGQDEARLFNIDQGDQDFASKDSRLFAMVVRNGDVTTVPEPGTLALMLAALGGLGLSARRSRH